METNISVLETRYIKINVFLCLGDHILVSRAPEFQRKLAQTCAGGDQYLVSRAQFCSDDRSREPDRLAVRVTARGLAQHAGCRPDRRSAAVRN